MDDLNLVMKKSGNDRTYINVGDACFGRDLVLMAGPCSIESYQQAETVALAVRRAGAHILRGGAFKPRTSPYSFQGLGQEGLEILKAAGKTAGLPVITEVVDVRDMELVCRYADIIQIGARNMQNFPLLKEAGRCGRPVLLKRSMYATLWEYLNCAEYILLEGNKELILCERGIRTFETYTRNTLDLSIVPALKELTHLPVVVDPSHGTGRASLVEPMSLAAVAAGADGLLIEVHNDPSSALSDRSQQLTSDEFASLSAKVQKARIFFSSI